MFNPLKNETKEERILIINELIKVIALNGRKFFSNKLDNDIAYVFFKNGRIYMYSEYTKTNMCLNTKYGYPPKKWHHGGTLWALTRDFKEFIQKGGYTNHNNGYGGLYCPHWGYDDESMNRVREKALELGYLEENIIP